MAAHRQQRLTAHQSRVEETSRQRRIVKSGRVQGPGAHPVQALASGHPVGIEAKRLVGEARGFHPDSSGEPTGIAGLPTERGRR